MRNANEIAAEVAARLQAEKVEELSAAQEDAQKLTDLRGAVESLRDHYGATFDDGPRSEEQSVLVQQEGQLLARWTRRGRTLVFQPESGRHPPREAADVEQAIAITVEFLIRRRSERRQPASDRLVASRRGLSGWIGR